MLHALAHRPKRCIGPADTLARLGGDEFILVVDLTPARGSVDSIATRLLSRVAEPLPVRRHKIVITASIGVSTFPGSGRTVEELIRNTDADSAEIFGAIIAFGRSLRLRLTAEGVETQEQREVLEARGCDELQGFLLGVPKAPTGLNIQ